MQVANTKALLSFASLLLPMAAQAQVAPSVQPSREEVNPPVPDSDRPQGSVEIDSRGAIEQTQCPLEASDIRATISEVRFSGPAGSPLPAELTPLLQGLGGVGADQPIKVVCDIRDRANAALRRAKYVATVQVPAQRIEDGVLRLEVVSARIVEVRVRGDAGPYQDLLESRIALLKAINPLNEAQAEQVLLVAGDVPGLDVQLSLRPTGGVPGDVIGEMIVTYRAFSLIANAQNYNSRQLGRETIYVRAEAYGLTGSADLTYLGLSSTVDFDEQIIGQVGHVMGVGNRGTTIAARATYAISKPDLDTLNLKTRSFIGSLEAAHPFVRRVNHNAGIAGGFEYARQKTTVAAGAGSAPLNLDEISALFVRVFGDTRSLRGDGIERARVRGTIEFRKGIDVFSPTRTGFATPGGFSPSRFDGDAQAFIVRGQADGRIGLGPIFSLGGEVRGQWSNKALLNYDEFSIGNLTIGRGYDPGANSGDRAIGVSVEPRATVLRRPSVEVQLFGFYDEVRLWNRDRGATENDRSLASYGGGARLVLPGRLLLEVTYARPLDRALTNDTKRPTDRLLLSLTSQLVPWGGRR